MRSVKTYMAPTPQSDMAAKTMITYSSTKLTPSSPIVPPCPYIARTAWWLHRVSSHLLLPTLLVEPFWTPIS